jgi:hypothetical protein
MLNKKINLFFLIFIYFYKNAFFLVKIVMKILAFNALEIIDCLHLHAPAPQDILMMALQMIAKVKKKS